MKKTFALCIALLPFLSFSQNKWQTYLSVEEGLHISDVSPSFNYANLSNAAGNAGMRIGTFYHATPNLSAEATLGIIGISTPGNFSNTIIPVELIGHYNLARNMELGFISKLNVDFGAGGGLAESNNGNFGIAEHLVVGASMELPNIAPFGTLIMGTRYTAFMDDYLDGTTVGGSSNDGILRFYTAVRLDGMGKKAKQAMANAEVLAGRVSASLEKSEAEKAAVQKELKAAKNAHAREKAALMDEIEALKAAPATKTPAEEISVAAEPKGYYVIIGSYPTKESAQRFIDDSNSAYTMSYMKYLDTYRVVYSMHESLGDARAALEEAKGIVETAWIAVY